MDAFPSHKVQSSSIVFRLRKRMGRLGRIYIDKIVYRPEEDGTLEDFFSLSKSNKGEDIN